MEYISITLSESFQQWLAEGRGIVEESKAMRRRERRRKVYMDRLKRFSRRRKRKPVLYPQREYASEEEEGEEKEEGIESTETSVKERESSESETELTPTESDTEKG